MTVMVGVHLMFYLMPSTGRQEWQRVVLGRNLDHSGLVRLPVRLRLRRNAVATSAHKCATNRKVGARGVEGDGREPV